MNAYKSQVVVGYDFSYSANEALRRAVALAARAPFHVLHFICVIEPHSTVPAVPGKHVDAEYAERVQEELAATVERELQATGTKERIHFNIHARIGHAAKEILELAREIGSDLIIVGSKGHTGLERIVLGSVAEKVVRHAKCTVEVARQKAYPHVELLDVVEVEKQGHYHKPHRYTYADSRASTRPSEWPLY